MIGSLFSRDRGAHQNLNKSLLRNLCRSIPAFREQRKQLPVVGRLCQVVVKTCGARALAVFVLPVSGDSDQQNVRQVRIPPQALRHLITVGGAELDATGFLDDIVGARGWGAPQLSTTDRSEMEADEPRQVQPKRTWQPC